jgi:hypothetical protein
MGNLDSLDIFFIVFLVFCAAAMVYTLFAWLQSLARWQRVSEETLALHREANDLLREVSRKLDRDQNP